MELNLEQQKLVNSKVTGHSLIKGVAGSGKTTVAVCRLMFLLRHYCYRLEDKVLFVTFNKSLSRYIKYLYSKVKNNDEGQMMLFETLSDDKVDILNIDRIIYKYFMEYCKEEHITLSPLFDRNLQYSIMGECISELKKQYPNERIMNQQYKDFLIKEIDWIKACDFEELEVYQTVDRLGRAGAVDGPQKIAKNSSTREAIYCLLNLYTERLRKENYCMFVDTAKYALTYVKKYNIKCYTHIVVDESQDLSKLQLDFLVQLYNGYDDSSIMFVADTAQSIYNNSWLIKGRTFSSIGLDMTGKSNSLAKNYRTTTQIAQAAYSLIENDMNIVQDANYVKPYLIDRQGDKPVLKGFPALEDELFYIKNVIESLASKYEYKDIVVVAKRKNLLDAASKYLGEDIPNCIFNTRKNQDFGEQAVKLITMHSIKGLEFKVVIIIGINEGVIPDLGGTSVQEDIENDISMERKLLYVGMTRATEKLFLSYHQVASKFIREINPTYLSLTLGSNVRAFRPIQLGEYKYTNQIIDIYGEEERVRQWFLKELHEVYKYPYELINVEHKVSIFSKVGSVDIVVSIYHNGIRIPYIFVEVKRQSFGNEQALSQLRSYMAAEPLCCYGVVTDGNQLIIIDKNQNEINDIPKYVESMSPSSLAKYEYLDFKSGNANIFYIDESNRSEFIIENNGIQELYNKEYLTNLSVVSRIAAGAPISIEYDNASEKQSMPIEWLRYNSENYILTVRGNSMIEAGINDGDRVIIHRASTADNSDIVAAEIDGEATLKRFTKAGSTVILIPCNAEYEPIMVQEDQVMIHGVAIGVIRKRG